MTNQTKAALETFRWAERTAPTNEVVAMFWNKLCEAVNEPPSASASRVMSELQAYGGNTIANFFRDGGVSYEEVTFDVAEALRPWLDDRIFTEGNAESCEAFVLRRMEVSEADLERMCASVGSAGNSEATAAQLKKAGGAVIIEAAGAAVAHQVASRAAAAAAQKAMAEAGKQVAKRAANEAAKKVTIEVAKQITARIMLSLNIALAALTLVSLAGPALRVTIPGVTYAALLRRLHTATKLGF